MHTLIAPRRRGRPRLTEFRSEAHRQAALRAQRTYQAIRTDPTHPRHQLAPVPPTPVPFDPAAVQQASVAQVSPTPWFRCASPAEKLAALEAKLDREQGVACPRHANGAPLPTRLPTQPA